MKILAIDSSGLVASVAVLEDDKLLAEYTVNYKKTHSQTLMPMLDEISKMIDLDLNTLDAIAISNGPGSFTGLRIGAASAKGIGLAINKPIVEVSTVEGLAFNLCGSSEYVCPIMDARRNEVYTGIFAFEKNAENGQYDMNTILEPVPVSIFDLLAKINEIGKSVIFTGDGIDVYKDIIAENIRVDYSFALPGLNRQSARSVGILGMRYFVEGKSVSARDSAPIYLRLSQAERELQEKNKLG